MAVFDEAIRYNSLRQEVLSNIDHIRELGIDVKEYTNKIIWIDQYVDRNMEQNTIPTHKEASYIGFYENGIKYLNNLLAEVEKYDVYYKILNSCKLIEMKLNDSIPMTLEELRKYVSEVIFNLKKLVRSETIKYEEEKPIVDKLYKVSYELIKQEILLTGSSNLYNYAVKEYINVSYFSKLVKEDIANLGDTKNAILKEKLLEIKKQGIGANYFDIDLIGRIVYADKGEMLLNGVTSKLESLEKEIVEKDDILAKEKEKLGNSKVYLDSHLYNIKEQRKLATKNIISFILSMVVLATGAHGISKLADWLAKQNVYIETTQTYSSLNGKTKTETDIIRRYNASGEPASDVKIREYVNGQRAYLEYDVSKNEVQFETAEEYYKYGIDKFEVEPKYKKNDDLVDFTLPECVEVEKTDYEYLRTVVDEGRIGIGILCYIVYVALMAIMSVATMYADVGIFGIALAKAFGAITDLYKDKRDAKDREKELAEEVSKILKIINEDQVLRDKYNALYEANKYLLNDPKELQKKLNQIPCTKEEIKKYIKTK